MARIISGGNPLYTSTETFGPSTKPQRIVPSQGSKLDRFVNALKVAESLATSKAVGAVAGLVGKGVSKLGETFEEAASVAQAQRLEEEQLAKQEAEAKALEGKAIPLKEVAKQKLLQAKQPVSTEEVEGDLAFRNAQKEYIGGLYQIQKSYDPEKTAYEKISKYVEEGVKNKFITPEQANAYVDKLVGKGEAKAQKLQAQELELSTQEAELKDESGKLSAERDVALSMALKEKQDKARQEAQPYLDLEEQYTEQARLGTPAEAESALEFANQNAERARQILENAKTLTNEEMSAIDSAFKEKAKKLTTRFPGGPAEPSAPQPVEEEAVVKDTGDVVSNVVNKVIESGKEKHRQVLLQLQQISKDRKLNPQEQELFDSLSVVYRDLYSTPSRQEAEKKYVEEARAEELASQTPSVKEYSGKVGGPVYGKAPEMRGKAKSPEQLKKEYEASRAVSAPPKGMTYVEEEVPIEQPYLEKAYGELTPEEAVRQEVSIPEQERRAAIVREGAKLNREAMALEEQAKVIRSKPVVLPEGVSKDERGNWVVDREKSYSESDLQSLASIADTKEKRAKVLQLVENADVAPATLVDIMTGSHKRNFAERLTRFFPKEAVVKETEADVALKLARAGKIVSETKEIAKNAETLRAQRKAQADKAVQQAEDLKEKLGAQYNGTEYWKSVIIKNLRKPAGRAGKSRQEKALAMLKAIEASKSKDIKNVKDYHEGNVKDAENAYKSVITKEDQVMKEYGSVPTPPTVPNTDNMNNKEANEALKAYNKAKKEYDDRSSAVKEIQAQKEERRKAVEKAREEQNKAVKEVEDAYSEVEAPIFKEATGKERPGKKASPAPAPTSKQKSGPVNPFE